MEFQKERCYTAVNADELKVGSRIYVGDNLFTLKHCIENKVYMTILKEVLPEDCMLRFRAGDSSDYALAYLIEPPEEKKLKVSDLKVGDILKHKEYNLSFIVTGIDYDVKQCYFNNAWLNDNELKDWEKTEE